MKSLTDSLTAAAFVVVALTGVLIGHNLPIESAYDTVNISSQEAYCEARGTPGVIGYPIVKYGDLRGCLYVDQADPSKQRIVKRVAM